MTQDSKRWEPHRFSDADWAGTSKALVANHADACGVVLHYSGPHIAMEIEEAHCGRGVEDLGLDTAPDGLSVWEGRYEWSGPTDPEGEGEMMPEGTFRPLTDQEWEALKLGFGLWKGPDPVAPTADPTFSNSAFWRRVDECRELIRKGNVRAGFVSDSSNMTAHLNGVLLGPGVAIVEGNNVQLTVALPISRDRDCGDGLLVWKRIDGGVREYRAVGPKEFKSGPVEPLVLEDFGWLWRPGEGEPCED